MIYLMLGQPYSSSAVLALIQWLLIPGGIHER